MRPPRLATYAVPRPLRIDVEEARCQMARKRAGHAVWHGADVAMVMAMLVPTGLMALRPMPDARGPTAYHPAARGPAALRTEAAEASALNAANLIDVANCKAGRGAQTVFLHFSHIDALKCKNGMPVGVVKEIRYLEAGKMLLHQGSYRFCMFTYQ